MVIDIADTIERRVAHVEVAGSQIDFCAQRHAAFRKFTGAHTAEQIEAFFDRTVTIWAGSRRIDIAAAGLEFFRGQFADISQSLFNQLFGIGIGLFKIIAAKIQAVIPGKAQPLDILLDSLHIFIILFGGVGIIETQVAQATKFFGDAEVDAQSLAMADMQISVRFRWKTGVNSFPFKAAAGREIFFDKFLDKIGGFHRFGGFVFNIRHVGSSFLYTNETGCIKAWQGRLSDGEAILLFPKV